MIAADQLRIAGAQGLAVGIMAKAQRLEGAALLGREARRIGAHGIPEGARPQVDRIERILEIRPARRLVHARGGPERPALPVPARGRVLGGDDLVGAHPGKPVIAGVEFAHMVEAEPAIVARAVKPGRAVAGRPEFALLAAPRPLAAAPLAARPPADAAMEPVVSHSVANGEESARLKPMSGPLAREIERLLTQQFAPTHLAVINDSA